MLNRDRNKGIWKMLSGKVKELWGKLTGDDLMRVNGKRQQLEGWFQERYGYGKEQAKEQARKYLDFLNRR